MDDDYLEEFVEDDPPAEGTTSTPAAKRRGPEKTWMLVEKFENAKDAERAVRDEQIWSIISRKRSTRGNIVEYRCKRGRYRRNECPVGIYLLYHSENFNVSMFKTDAEHQHQDNDDNTRGLNQSLKQFIKSQFEDGAVRSKDILVRIREANLREPPKMKIMNYLRILRRAKYGNPSISVKEITEWCVENSKIPLDDEDRPFVLRHFVEFDTAEADEQDLKLFITTKRLLNNMPLAEMLQIDSSHKLIWQGYPVFLTGTSDKNHTFHPLGLAVCTNETASDYRFIFESLKSYNSNWKPNILLADASVEITQGFIGVFGVPKVRLTCFLRVLQNVEKSLKHSKERDEIKTDIKTLQMCKDECTFNAGVELFLNKWMENKSVEEFLTCFKKQWLEENRYWYEGAAVGYPSTNNGIETAQAIIKKEYTFRERCPVGPFLNLLFKITNDWSISRNPQSPNCTVFNSVRSISLKEWTDGYQWALANKRVKKEETGDVSLFYTNASTTDDIILEDEIKKYTDTFGKWETFDDFKNSLFSLWLIEINEADINASSCTCPYFLKHNSCEHLLGIQIRCKLIEVPKEAKVIPSLSGRKRKGGAQKPLQRKRTTES